MIVSFVVIPITINNNLANIIGGGYPYGRKLSSDLGESMGLDWGPHSRGHTIYYESNTATAI